MDVTHSCAGRRIWLKPGKHYLFGRTKGTHSRYRFVIDRPSISRQHITLVVDPIGKDDSGVVNKKTTLIVKDEGSKFGTELDGVRVEANSKTTLTRDVHSIRLGKAADVFRLRWTPVVLTFSLGAKESKIQDPLSGHRSRLEDAGLDVKVSLPFVVGATTHVVASKRNTAKGLSALINGQHIVSERFVDAIIAAATPTDLDREEEVSHLEDDLDKYWPRAAEYLPDKGKEPNDRPVDDYIPSADRSAVFEGYTFIFCDHNQFDTLQAPITQGGGKALYCTVSPGITPSNEVVRYVKTAAGEKGLGELEDGSEGKGVVVVRLTRKEKHADWAMQIDLEVAQALDHRLIEQSEFLNAILSNDASMLRKPLLPEDYDRVAQNGNGTQPQRQTMTDSGTILASKASPITRNRRPPVVSRFKGFDDDDDEEDDNVSVTRPAPSTQRSMSSHAPASSSRHRKTQPSFAPDSEDEQSSTPKSAPTRNGNPRKRPPPSDHDEDEDIVDKLLPQHTARKRQRQQASQEEDAVILEAEFEEPKLVNSKAKPLDVKAAVRERMRAAEEAEEDEKLNIREVLDNMTLEEMKSLAVIEEVELVQPTRRNHQVANSAGQGWNDAWNGRKNFKRFRRKGTGEGHHYRNTDRIIVALEETKRKDYGIGDDYWLEDHETESSGRRRKGDSGRTQTQSQFVQSQSRSAASVPSELVLDSGDAHVPEVIDIDAPRSTRHGRQSTNDSSSNNTRASQGQVLAEKPSARNSQVSKVVLPGPRKRKKFAAAQDSDESDDGGDEDTGRFVKRVRGRA